jgi:hypothetical protein
MRIRFGGAADAQKSIEADALRPFKDLIVCLSLELTRRSTDELARILSDLRDDYNGFLGRMAALPGPVRTDGREFR